MEIIKDLETNEILDIDKDSLLAPLTQTVEKPLSQYSNKKIEDEEGMIDQNNYKINENGLNGTDKRHDHNEVVHNNVAEYFDDSDDDLLNGFTMSLDDTIIK